MRIFSHLFKPTKTHTATRKTLCEHMAKIRTSIISSKGNTQLEGERTAFLGFNRI